jgi:hypothetical protein
MAEGVLTGNGGNADEARIGLEGVSGIAGVFGAALPGTVTLSPAVTLLSLDLLVVGFAGGITDGSVDPFLLLTDPAFTGRIGLVEDGVGGALLALLSRAGKSSDWRAGCEACKAMALESPVFAARVLTSCLARDIDVWRRDIDVISDAGRDGVGGTDTLASGVPARGMKGLLRDGVNGAEVGTIRDVGFETGSSILGGGGCPCGSSKPGGTVGVEVLVL